MFFVPLTVLSQNGLKLARTHFSQSFLPQRLNKLTRPNLKSYGKFIKLSQESNYLQVGTVVKTLLPSLSLKCSLTEWIPT